MKLKFQCQKVDWNTVTMPICLHIDLGCFCALTGKVSFSKDSVACKAKNIYSASFRENGCPLLYQS